MTFPILMNAVVMVGYLALRKIVILELHNLFVMLKNSFV